MAGSKPEGSDTKSTLVGPPTRVDGGSGRISKAVPPPLPSAMARSSRNIRAAAPLDSDGEAPTMYSVVGRRSSPGIEAVAVAAVESVRSPPVIPSSPPVPARPQPPRMPVDDASALRAAWSTPEAHEEPAPATEKLARPPLSVRPPAPEPFAADTSTSESIAQTFDRLLGSEVDSQFAALKRDSARPDAAGSASATAGELTEVRALFEQLAANHVRPVRDFVIDLRWGEASREWVGICTPAVESLRRAAEKLDLVELLVALDDFGAALTAAEKEETQATIDGVARDRLLAAYDELVLVLPKAFALDMDRAERESIIVQSLLLKIPDVRRVTLDRLYAAGLNGIAILAGASAHEVADMAGISPRVAERIVEAFDTYRSDLQANAPDAERSHERGRIEALLAELEAQHASFESAASAWTLEATEEKKRLRRARHETLMAISVMLARLGEVALLHALEKAPFERKLEGLRSYLKAARDPSPPAP